MKKSAMPRTAPRDNQSSGAVQYLNKNARTTAGAMLKRAATGGRQAQAIAVPKKSQADARYQAPRSCSDWLEIRIEPATVKYAAEAMRHSVRYFIGLMDYGICVARVVRARQILG